MRNVTELQRRLITLGFLAPGGDDGIFGQKSLDAYNHFRASKGNPPHTGMLILAELNADLFPEERPAPAATPARKPGLTDVLALVFTLFTSKGKPMKWSTIEQLIRILAYSGGSYFLGDAVANGDAYKAAIGGLISLGAFVWWLVFERNRPKAE